jgi:hypothetical protein
MGSEIYKKQFNSENVTGIWVVALRTVHISLNVVG